MPQNTQPGSLGTPVGYQNPATTSLVLDAEVVGVDVNTGAQLTREFVIPLESVSGQTIDTQTLDILVQMLTELKKIRICMELDSVPGLADEISIEELAGLGAEEDTGGGSEEN
jgi:hypothetical protein